MLGFRKGNSPISDMAFSNRKRYSLLFPQGPKAVAIWLKKLMKNQGVKHSHTHTHKKEKKC